MQASTYHPNLAATLPADVTGRVKNILMQSAWALGMFECYESRAKKDRTLEPPHETDRLTANVLANLCERTCSMFANSESLEERGVRKGYHDIIKQRVRSISQIRNAAYTVIANGWNIEDEHPELQLTSDDRTLDTTDARISPDTEIDEFTAESCSANASKPEETVFDM